MKQVLRFLALAALLAAPWGGYFNQVQAQTIVTIGEGTSTIYYPMPGYFGFQYDVYIYTPSEAAALGADCDISSIAWYISTNSTTSDAQMTIWVKDVDDDYALATATTFAEYTTGATQVYSTDDLSTTTGWNTFDFSSTFSHEGGKALLVAVRGVGCTTSGGCSRNCRYTTVTNAHWYKRADSSDPGTSATGSIDASRSNIQLAITYTGSVCLTPSGMTSTNVTHNSANLTWNENGSADGWILQYGTDNTFAVNTQVNVSTTPSYALTGLSPLTTYYARVKPNCDNDDSHWSGSYSFSTTAVAEAVGDSWSDDFEGAECGWDLINGTLTNKWCWGTATNNGGTHALYVSNDDGATTNYSASGTKIFATKLLQFADGKYEFSYDWLCKGESTYDFLRVALVPASQTLTAGTDYSTIGTSSLPSGWTALDGGGKLNLQETWQNKVVAINVAAGNYYMVLVWRNDSGVYPPAAAVDNVSITRIACAYDVADLAVTPGSITTTGATITWTAGEATQWQVAYGTSSTFEGAATATVGAATYDMTSLAPSTVYYARVRAYCGGTDYGSWSAPINFATECEAISAPYNQNFDALTTGSNVLPLCWSYINTTTYNDYKVNPRVYNYSANSPSNCLYFYSYYSSYYSSYDPQPQYAILPEMTGLAGKQVTLMAKGYNSSSTFKIGTMSDPTDANTFSLITEQALTTSYQEFEYIIPNNTDHYLAIMIDAATSSRTSNGVYIDDISIANPPTCPKPSALMPTARTAHTATLTWTNGDAETAWQIVYSTESTFDPDGATPEDVTTKPYTLTGLNASTTYYAYVRANCGGGDESAWCTTKATFTTTNGIGTPTGLAVDNATLAHNTATVTWSRVATNDLHESFDIYFSTDGTAPTAETVPTYTGITAMTYTFTGLIEATTYYVWVRDVCGTDGTSAWSSRLTINTTVFCPAPTGVAVSSATAHGATISWTGTSDSYNVYVGMATVNSTTYDFEDNAISADFTNDATNAWEVTTSDKHAGTYSIKSAGGFTSTQSDLTLTVNLTEAATITFWDKASSESSDYGRFLIDGVQKHQTSGTSGSWTKRTYDLTAGSHTLVWRYYKDYSVNSGDDCYYVDDISITSVEVASWESYEAPASPYVLNDGSAIDPETDYAVKVVGVCESVESTRESATVLFTTSADCGASNVAVSNVSFHGADVTWDGSSDAGYMVMLGYDEVASDFVNENFAGGVPTSAEWTNDATYPWTAVDGYIKSGNGGHASTTSQLSLTVDMDAAGYIEFDAECRGEGTSSYWDYSTFTIDGTEKFKYAAHRTNDGFVHYSFPVAAGTHTFVWKYTKDSSTDPDGDYMAIDNLHIYTTNITWDEVEVVDVNNYTFDGLEDNTHYYVKVSPECNRTIESNAAEFTTLALPTFNVKANNWYALSSPMHDAGQTYESVANVENLTTGTYDFLRYDEPSSTWESQKTHFSTLEPGRGYIYRRANDAVLKVDGEPNTGNVDVDITKDVDGWNLIGNPFMVPIRLNSTYMAPSSNAVLTSGGYKLSTNGMWTAITSSTDIAVGQAVLVKATTAGTLTLRPSASKSAASEEENGQGFVFSLSNDVYSDVAYAMFADGEGLPKISHLNPEAPMLSIDGYAIANLNEGTESFPMSVSGQGSYTLTVSGNTDVTGYLHLVDRATGRDIDLLSTPSYSFTGSPVSDRFIVKLTPDANEGSSTSRFAIFDGNSLIVNGEGTLEVYDVMGRRLMSAEVTGSEYRIPGSDLHTGVYVLRMNGNSQKIVIK